MSAPQITWIGVVVPAHNEQELLPGCLAGLAAAAAAVPVPVEMLVVLDSCTDASPAAAGKVPTMTVDERNVGAARRSGFGRLLHSRPAGVPDSQTWLATTDADTVVPPNWLTGMLKTRRPRMGRDRRHRAGGRLGRPYPGNARCLARRLRQPGRSSACPRCEPGLSRGCLSPGRGDGPHRPLRGRPADLGSRGSGAPGASDWRAPGRHQRPAPGQGRGRFRVLPAAGR